MITLRQLRYFDALMETGHFGRAADRCAVTQPALSMQIKELEIILGAPLFERTSTGVKPTVFGIEAIQRARGILSAVSDLERTAHHGADTLAGSFRLGVIPSVSPGLLPHLLKALPREAPSLVLSLDESVTDRLLVALADGGLDGIVVSVPPEREDFRYDVICEDRFLLAAPSHRPVVFPLLPAALDSDDLLLLEEGHCLRDQALAVCSNINRKALRRFGATSMNTLLQLVAADLGVTLVPELLAPLAQDPRIALSRFVAPEPSRTLGLVWRASAPRQDGFRRLAAIMRRCLAAAETASWPYRGLSVPEAAATEPLT